MRSIGDYVDMGLEVATAADGHRGAALTIGAVAVAALAVGVIRSLRDGQPLDLREVPQFGHEDIDWNLEWVGVDPAKLSHIGALDPEDLAVYLDTLLTSDDPRARQTGEYFAAKCGGAPVALLSEADRLGQRAVDYYNIDLPMPKLAPAPTSYCASLPAQSADAVDSVALARDGIRRLRGETVATRLLPPEARAYGFSWNVSDVRLRPLRVKDSRITSATVLLTHPRAGDAPSTVRRTFLTVDEPVSLGMTPIEDIADF